MLFRLSRVSFWLAAAAAALALLAPGGRETLLTGVVLGASAVAFLSWRSAVSHQRRSHAAPTAVAESVVLTQAALREAGMLLVRQADEAASFEAALHVVARVLRGELGARRTVIHEVGAIDATHAQLMDMVEASPGFRGKARAVRLDSVPTGQAIRTQVEAGTPPASVAVPVTAAERVIAVIELGAFDVPVEPEALTGLLQLARQTLSRLAPVPHLHGHVLVIEDRGVQAEPAARMLRRMGCRVTAASGMLEGRELQGRTQFDLILVDLEAPGAEGGEGPDQTCHAGAGGAGTAGNAPWVAMGGPDTPGHTQRLRELGFDDHVCRPFGQNEMLALLNKHLRKRAPAESCESGAPAAAAPVLDPMALARLIELDPSGANHLLERVLQAFRTSVARLRPQADAARLSGDQAALRLVAHTLKSSSASIGAMHLSQLCAQIETAIRTASDDKLDDQLDALGTELDKVLAAIDQLLKERA